MAGPIDIAQVAALVGDPARANILDALLDGRALTATELAYCAGVSPQTASGHLTRLTDGQLLTVMKQGRHRYYRLAGDHVGRMLESIMAVASVGPQRHRPASRQDDALRFARTCYDHFAGRLGVGLVDGLGARGALILSPEAGELTDAGAALLDDFGVDMAKLRAQRRMFCRPCLDWTERRLHLGGAVGAALAARCFELGWTKHQKAGRAVLVTPPGRRGLAEVFGVAF